MKEDRELEFWSTYSSHLCETDKQTFYAIQTGLVTDDKYPYVINMNGKSVLEIGGGPVGLTLRVPSNSRRKVIDPSPYPQWVKDRYQYFGIEYESIKAEDMNESGWDEVWLFNVMQHIDNPDQAFENIIKSAKVIRIFEWLNTPIDESHPSSFTKEWYDNKLNIIGATMPVRQPYMYQTDAYYGVYNTPVTSPMIWGNMDRAMIHYMRGKYNNTPITGIEIGVLDGINSLFMFRMLNIEKLYLIDPYTAYDSDIYTQKELDGHRHNAYNNLEQYRDRVHFIHLKSDDAIEYFKRNNIKVNFCYIDGLHTEEGTYNDIINYCSVTLDFIGGHDYLSESGMKHWLSLVRGNPSYTDKVQMGVKQAVDTYFAKENTSFYISDFQYSDWWVDKTHDKGNKDGI